MATFTASKALVAPFKSSVRVNKHHQRCAHVVSCSATPDRRSLLAGIAGAISTLPFLSVSPAEAKLVDKVISAKYLTSFQRADLMADFTNRYETELKKVLSIQDANTALRLLLHDAATYDAINKTGGVNGSIVTSEELSRPENKDLKDLVAKLSKARDAAYATGPAAQKKLSWADTIVLAVKVTQQLEWYADKLAKNPKNGEFLAAKFSNPINVRLGRVDATTPDAPGRFPAPGSSPAEVQKFFSSFAVKDMSALDGPFGRKAPFWERLTFVLWTAAQVDPAAAEAAFGADPAYADFKDKYDKSRTTSFRTDYEIDFNDYFNKLADVGATFNKDAYLYDITVKVPDTL